MMEVRVEIEGDTFFAQGFHAGRNIFDAEAEYGVFVCGEIWYGGDAQSDSGYVEDGGEVVFRGQGQTKGVAIEHRGACAVSRADYDCRLCSFQNAHVVVPFF